MKKDPVAVPIRPWQAWDLERPTVALGLYAFLAAVFCFWRLGAVGVIRMEGMVLDGARHMLESGDWLVPRVYGEIYTYKPALSYWLASAPLRLADQPSEWLLRFPFALSAFVMGLVVLLLVARVAGYRTAFLCSMASISSGLFIQKVRIAEFDGPLAAGLGVAVAAACANLAAPRARAGIWIVSYLGLAFGFLAKGLPALACFGPGLLAAAWNTHSLRRLIGWRHLVGVLVFVALAGGYLAAAYRSVGAVAFSQPLLESRIRGFGWSIRQRGEVMSALHEDATPEALGEEGVSASPLASVLRSFLKPVYVLVAFLPWSLAVPFAFRRREGGEGNRGAPLTALVGAAKAFLLATLAVFMLIPTHEMRYYLPVCASIGILAGTVLAREESGRGSRLRLRLFGVVAVLMVLSVVVAGFFMPSPAVPLQNRITLVLVGLPLLVWIFHQARRPRLLPSPLALLLISALGFLAIESLASQPRRASKRDLSAQARALARYLPDNETVWILGPADLAGKSSSLFYYLDRPVRTFRPGLEMPPAGSRCILSSDRLGELPEPSGLAFEEIARVPDAWRTYLLGDCSGEPSTNVGESLSGS